MYRLGPICLLFVLIFSSFCQGAEDAMTHIKKRCASCHQWAANKAGVQGRAKELKRRIFIADRHVVGRFNGSELLLVKRMLGPVDEKKVDKRPINPYKGPSKWMDFKKPVDTTSKGVGPFSPCELGCDDPMPTYEEPSCRACESEGSFTKKRRRALRDIKIHCGRCHSWASRPHLIVREHARIIPKIMSGHGIHRLAKHRRKFLLKAFKPSFVEAWKKRPKSTEPKITKKLSPLPVQPNIEPPSSGDDDDDIFDDIDNDDEDIDIEDM